MPAIASAASWLILRSSEAECLTTSSTVTGRLCFHVSVRDNRLCRAWLVPVCPANVFVFISGLRRAFLFLLTVIPKEKSMRDPGRVHVVHAMKSAPGEASEKDQYQRTGLMCRSEVAALTPHAANAKGENDPIVLANGFHVYLPSSVTFTCASIHVRAYSM